MEAVVVCIDNSEWTRNGDYAPSRFQAQADAVNLLAGAKTESNPENTIGVLSMAGKSPRVLVTPTQDLGKILNGMQDLEIEGVSNLARSVQIAQLALKHRQNKHQRQRIVLFVGSPIAEDEAMLVKIAKNLKKNNVAVDVVSLEADTENIPKLQAFQAAVNSNDNSHLVLVPVGTTLADNLYNTPLFQGEGMGYAAASMGGNGGSDMDLGIDPNIDPGLALALRVSLEEERARQEAAAAAAAKNGKEADGDAELHASGSGAIPMDTLLDDEDALLQQALAMSMATDNGSFASSNTEPADTTMFESIAYDELQTALQLSLQEKQPGDDTESKKSDKEKDESKD